MRPLLTSGAFLVLANLIPLIGTLAWDWSILEIVAVYWAENLVIGLFTIFRLLTVSADESGSASIAAKLAVSAFFTVHYGIFCLVHGVFVFVLLGGDCGLSGPANAAHLFAGTLKWAILALIISHGVSFFRNYLGEGENRVTSVLAEMAAPYPRLFVLHFAIILGAFAIQAAGQPAFLLVILVIGKTLLDLKLHRLARKRVAKSASPFKALAGQWAERVRK